MLIQADRLRHLISEIFATAGCSSTESDGIAKYLVAANLTGHDSHGVIRTQRYIEWLFEGKVKAGRQLEVISESDVMAVVDGGQGFGQTIGPQAVRLGIDKASDRGIAIIALRNSGHLGRIGDWAEMAAAAEQISVHFVNARGSLLVAPFGGVDRRFSTDPYCVGVPMSDGPPLVLDFATSVVAEGKVLVAQNGGKPVPPNGLITPEGDLSSDPYVLYGEVEPGHSPNPNNGPGAIRAMGEHKGSGLALMCELLGGALTGTGCAGPGNRAFANGMLSIYMNIDFFHSGDYFAQEAQQYVEFVKSSRPAAAGGEVLVPGEPERRNRQTRLAEGIPITDAAWRSIMEAATTVGLEQQRIDALIAAGDFQE